MKPIKSVIFTLLTCLSFTLSAGASITSDADVDKLILELSGTPAIETNKSLPTDIPQKTPLQIASPSDQDQPQTESTVEPDAEPEPQIEDVGKFIESE